MKFVSIHFALEQRWNGSAIDKHICLDIAPHLCKPKCQNHRAAVFYAFRDSVYESATLQSLFQIDELQRRGCVQVVPSCVCQLNNRLSREFCVWIECPAQFVQY